MDDGVSWLSILHSFVLLDVTVTKFTDYYYTGRGLMVSNTTQIKDVINHHNKMHRNHTGLYQNCYINATNMNRILEFHRWAVFAIKYFGEEYDIVSDTAFDCDWVESIIYE